MASLYKLEGARRESDVGINSIYIKRFFDLLLADSDVDDEL